jgi:hypothetical protein
VEQQSLGLIETVGLVAAVEAADAGTKAANVKLLGYWNVDAGLITIKFIGDVGAVKAAVMAAEAAAKRVGKIVSVHVIPRPDRQLSRGPNLIPPSAGESGPPKGPPVAPGPPKDETGAALQTPPEEKQVEKASPQTLPLAAEPAAAAPEKKKKETRVKKSDGKGKKG